MVFFTQNVTGWGIWAHRGELLVCIYLPVAGVFKGTSTPEGSGPEVTLLVGHGLFTHPVNIVL